jgi:hypothetical protein
MSDKYQSMKGNKKLAKDSPLKKKREDSGDSNGNSRKKIKVIEDTHDGGDVWEGKGTKSLH